MAIFRVPKNQKYGFVDMNGNEVIPFINDDLSIYVD